MKNDWASRSLNYILDADGEPQPVTDIETWGRWYEKATKDRSRIVAQDRDENGASDVLVSTVFLGLDHQFGDGPPVLWETMILGGPLDGEQRRYTSKAAAFKGHQAMCERAAEANAAARTKDGDRVDGGFTQEPNVWLMPHMTNRRGSNSTKPFSTRAIPSLSRIVSTSTISTPREPTPRRGS